MPWDTDTSIETMILVIEVGDTHRQHEIHRPEREAGTDIERKDRSPPNVLLSPEDRHKRKM